MKEFDEKTVFLMIPLRMIIIICSLIESYYEFFKITRILRINMIRMTQRDVVLDVLKHKKPPYVPWHFGFTLEAKRKLLNYFGSYDLVEVTDNHLLILGDEKGLNNFNPFQAEVVDIYKLLPKYRGRLTFHGGLSTQRILPFGEVEDVQKECDRLLELGNNVAYIFTPSHDVEGDLPLENILAFIQKAKNQVGYENAAK